MGIGKALPLLEKRHGAFGACKGLTRLDSPFKRENIRVVHHLNAQAPSIHLGALHVTGRLVHHHVTLAGQGVALHHRGIVHAPGVTDFMRQHAIERRNLKV